MSTARGLSPVTRRRALTTLAVGVFAPNVLAACFGGSTKQAEKAKPPAEATITFRPADKTAKVLPTTPISVEVRDGWFQHVALTNADGKVDRGLPSTGTAPCTPSPSRWATTGPTPGAGRRSAMTVKPSR